MGHLLGKQEILKQLRKRLHKNPIGLPEHSSVYEILSILFTEKEAEVGSKFPLGTVTIEKLQNVIRMGRDELEEILRGMMKKGLVVTIKRMARPNISFLRLLSDSLSLPLCESVTLFL